MSWDHRKLGGGVLILRDATPEDAAGLEDIRVRAWLHAYAGKAEQDVFDALQPRTSSAGSTNGSEMIDGDSPITSVRAVEDDGELTGFCAVAAPTRDDDEPEGVAEIVALYIDPDAQRRGYGRALLDDAIASLSADEWKEVTVWTLEDNFRSLPLYESRGFKHDGSVRTESGWFVADVRLREDAQPDLPSGTLPEQRAVGLSRQPSSAIITTNAFCSSLSSKVVSNSERA